MNYSRLSRMIVIAVAATLCTAPRGPAAELRRLTLAEAVHLAIAQNRGLKIAKLKIDERQEKKAGDHSSYIPKITNQSNIVHVTELQNVGIPAWVIGVSGVTLIPSEGI